MKDRFRQDVEFAFRMMRRKPAFTVVVILTLAIGIGVNTAIFSIVDSVLLRPLPYKDPHQLVVFWAEFKNRPGEKAFVSYADFLELKKSAHNFEELAATTWANAGQTLIWRSEPHRVLAIPSTDRLFSLLGVNAIHGRTFNSEDLQRACTVVLSNGFWQTRLGADAGIVNKNLTLDGQSCSVAGVMPPGFEFFPKQTDLWTLITPNSAFVKDPNASVAVFGRVGNGITREAAQAEVTAIHRVVAQTVGPTSWIRDSIPLVYDLRDEFSFLSGPQLKRALWMLFAAVGMILLIACVNVAGLLLTRGAERRKELAVRAALGCGRSRIMGQLLTESMIFSIFGAAIGLAFAIWGVAYFRQSDPINLPPGNVVEVNSAVLVFTAVITIFTALLFGLLPSFRISRIDLNDILKGIESRMTRNLLQSTGGKLLIIAEVGLAMMLLVAAGLLSQSIYRLMATPLNFKPDRLWVATVTLPSEAYKEVTDRSRFYDALMSAIAEVPKIEAVAMSSNAPLGGQNGAAVTIAGRVQPPGSDFGDVGAEFISSNFMDVMGIPMLRGRRFDSRDHERSAQVAIVNSKFASEYFPNEDPIGRQFKFGLPNTPNPWLTIVGISADVERRDFFKEMGYRYVPVAYRPIAQASRAATFLLVRANDPENGLMAALQTAVAALDARVPVHDLISANKLLSSNFSQPRFRTFLLAAFAGLALFLAAIGLYGMLSQTVLQLTRDIGIRMALGAARQDILRMVVRQGMGLVTIGIAIGVLASLYFTRLLASMLYGVQSTDFFTFAITSIVLIGVTLVAIGIPARRATRVNPIIALKQD
jgi:putative ABC transport system permease protein